jgi:hypothetical protein
MNTKRRVSDLGHEPTQTAQPQGALLGRCGRTLLVAELHRAPSSAAAPVEVAGQSERDRTTVRSQQLSALLSGASKRGPQSTGERELPQTRWLPRPGSVCIAKRAKAR